LAIEPLPLRLTNATALAGVLVTSGNALAALLPGCRDRLILTVGDATAQRARATGFHNVVSADGDATALAALLRRRLRPQDGTLLLASGQGQGQALAADLRGDGYRVIRRVVYLARPVSALSDAAAAALAGRQVRAALFFSADTAHHFVRLVQRAGLTNAVGPSEAVAIGQAAGMALERLPWRRIRVAAKPNQNEMLVLLQ
jgi:uroporphyrinogen-III synthase